MAEEILNSRLRYQGKPRSKKKTLPEWCLMACAVYYGDRCLLVSSQGDREQDWSWSSSGKYYLKVFEIWVQIRCALIPNSNKPQLLKLAASIEDRYATINYENDDKPLWIVLKAILSCSVHVIWIYLMVQKYKRLAI